MAKWDLRPLGVGPSEPRRKVYLLTRIVRAPTYDSVSSMVVRAFDEKEARQLASEKAMDEGKDTWIRDDYSTCEIIHSVGDSQVMCVDATNG